MKPSLEYIAGFFDGEGCVSIVCITPEKIKNQKSNRYQLVVELTNTNEKIMKEIQSVIGGRLSSYGRRPANWKPSFRLIFASAKALDMLIKIAPYVRLKKPIVELGIEFQKQKVIGSHVIRDGGSKYYNKAKLLNQRGIKTKKVN
jgi:hypothetical protein